MTTDLMYASTYGNSSTRYSVMDITDFLNCSVPLVTFKRYKALNCLVDS